MIEIPKGTKDLLPQNSYKWHFVEEKVREVTKKYNVKEIRTPIFEHTELFLRGIGNSTDIVNKEMYTFLDKGERSITLKPEGTAGVARSFIENGLFNNPQPTKMYYVSPIFRYENPQAGRLRQHHQFGIEYYGSDSPKSELEVISLATDFLKSIGLDDIVVHINSIGCSECRKKYNDALREYIRPRLKDMCGDCNRRFTTNPLRILDCKVEHCQELLKDRPKLQDFLCDDCKAHFNSLLKLLDTAKINYVVDYNVVRGLDYYTRTVFEFFANIQGMGSVGVVGGGGRYNYLVEELGGPHTPAVGFGMGIERLLMVLEMTGKEIPDTNRVQVYIAKQPSLDTTKDVEIAKLLRDNGITCEVDLLDRSFKAQFKYANKIGAKYVFVLGEEELGNNTMTVKDMEKGEEKKVAFDKLLEIF